MTATPLAPAADVGVLLGLTGRSARILAGLYALTMAVLALTTGALQNTSELVALVIVLAAAVVLIAPGEPPPSFGPDVL